MLKLFCKSGLHDCLWRTRLTLTHQSSIFAPIHTTMYACRHTWTKASFIYSVNACMNCVHAEVGRPTRYCRQLKLFAGMNYPHAHTHVKYLLHKLCVHAWCTLCVCVMHLFSHSLIESWRVYASMLYFLNCGAMHTISICAVCGWLTNKYVSITAWMYQKCWVLCTDTVA